MPSSKVKAKNAAAHQHDKRHESGLAAPGKRVVRQRSHTSLQSSGHVNGRPATPADSSPLAYSTAIAGVEHLLDHSRPTETIRSSTKLAATQRARDDTTPALEQGYRVRTNSDVSHEGAPYQHGDTDDGLQDDVGYFTTGEPSRRPGHVGHSNGPLAAVSTILTYYPLRDAISILILLLSLPATLVLVIQTLFASLTFVPPTTNISLPSIKEMFNASSLGYPALATILFVDLLFYLCWLPLWPPVQNVLLDLSQAVVAVSLSGAAASIGGPTYSIATCSALVCVVHVLRYKAIHLTALDYLRSVLHKTDLGVNLSVSFTSTPFFNHINNSEHSWIFSTVRTVLGIHIVSQGLTTCVRRSLASQNEKPPSAPVSAKTDTEAATGHDPAPARINTLDTAQHGATPPNGMPNSVRDTRARDSGRKRRKQALEIRGNQPLWAAIASTKVTFVKEMEHRDAADDAKESAIMEKLASVGHIPVKLPVNRIWVSTIFDTEVSLCADIDTENDDSNCSNSDASRGASEAWPFCVRVNGAIWKSMKVSSTRLNPNVDHVKLDIFGLTPHTSYQCGIFTGDGSTQLCTISFVTQHAQAAERVTPVAPPVPAHQALRPSSPATTLRRSIEQASASLAEAKNKTKKTRKDQRAAYSDIRKEIKELKNKLDNGGGHDDRQARRLQQFTQHKNQAEEATVHTSRQIEELGDVPITDVATAEANKSKWQVASDERSAAQARFEDVKQEADKLEREIKADINAAEQKRERLSARYQQRKDELASAAAKHQAELTARQKHMLERLARRDEQDKLEAQLRFHIASMDTEAEMYNTKAVEAYQQGQNLHGAWVEASSPPTPDHARLASNGLPGMQPYEMPYNAPQQGHTARARSSSLLSDYSSFIDEAEDGAIRMPPESVWPLQKTGFGTAIIDVRKKSETSSGSSGTNESTASSSPRPDALTRPLISTRMSPIAPPRKSASPQIGVHGSRLPATDASINDR